MKFVKFTVLSSFFLSSIVFASSAEQLRGVTVNNVIAVTKQFNRKLSRGKLNTNTQFKDFLETMEPISPNDVYEVQIPQLTAGSFDMKEEDSEGTETTWSVPVTRQPKQVADGQTDYIVIETVIETVTCKMLKYHEDTRFGGYAYFPDCKVVKAELASNN